MQMLTQKIHSTDWSRDFATFTWMKNQDASLKRSLKRQTTKSRWFLKIDRRISILRLLVVELQQQVPRKSEKAKCFILIFIF